MCLFCGLLRGTVEVDLEAVQRRERITKEKYGGLVDLHPESGSFGDEIGALGSWKDVPI